MKRIYSTPKLTKIGDMVHNTLGASGTEFDGFGQVNGQGAADQNNVNNPGFDNNNFGR